MYFVFTYFIICSKLSLSFWKRSHFYLKRPVLIGIQEIMFKARRQTSVNKNSLTYGLCLILYLLFLWPTKKARYIFNEKKWPRCQVKLETSMIFISEAISIITRRNTLCINKFRNFLFFCSIYLNFLVKYIQF